jgi:hypothetical protein
MREGQRLELDLVDVQKSTSGYSAGRSSRAKVV